MIYTPTEEQSNIVSAVKNTEDNILVQALAGAAKTSTLELIAHAIPEVQILCLSFNKKIAVEMEARMPPNCKVMTLNSLGHRVWSESIGRRRLRIDSSKIYALTKEYIERLASDERGPLYDNMGELMKLVSFGKQCGYVPNNFSTPLPFKPRPLMDDSEFFEHIDHELSDAEMDLIIHVTNTSIKLALEDALLDYDDQIFMPTIFPATFPRYPLILVDEAQDLSALNHAMLRKLVKKRLIAVGDSNQAIYGFRGAHENSMNLLRNAFSMTTFTLSISFRCARKIVEAARWKAPNMKYPDWAAEGSVTALSSWKASDLAEDAMIICRNNAPLFTTAIRLIKNGRSAELDGRDVVNYLVKIMKKFGSSDLPQSEVLISIDRWLAEQMDKTKERAWGALEDRAECMRIFAREAPDLGGAVAYASHISQMHSPLKLMTGHKSKGLESEIVYFLDEKLVKKTEQDPNLRYVIQTRAKNQLIYINSIDFIDG